MLNRIKKILILSKLDSAHLDFLLGVSEIMVPAANEAEVIDEMGHVDMAKLKALVDNGTTYVTLTEDDQIVRGTYPTLVAGNEKGEFLPDMSDDEVLDYERKERMGWKELKLPWQSGN